MKKTVRIISTILLTIMLVTSIAGVVFAAPDIDKTIGDIDGAKAGDTTKVTTIGGKIINIIQVVGIVVAIAVVLIIGIKYMTGSVEQKAEYKKVMIPYIIGAVLLVAGTSIVKVIFNTINSNAAA
ncbi:MAG: pilin [Clostridium sp.]|nr:pilin [Clostridium sp.]CCZ18810.1 unknown [Clostridium sp. CAG:780]